MSHHSTDCYKTIGNYVPSCDYCVESQTPGICLIQGPPGTGKFTVIKNIIASVLSRKLTPRVLVCAPSNKAVDELAQRLLAIQLLMEDQGIPWNIVRVGREDKIHKSVESVSLLNLRKSVNIFFIITIGNYLQVGLAPFWALTR